MRRVILVIGLALAASQAGHLIAYAARFGGAAVPMQSSGAHAYFPLAAKTALGLVASALLLALLLIAVSRLLARGSGYRVIAAGPSFVSLFAILFTVQLLFFVIQETLEAAAAGVPADTVSDLVLWGMLGQLPAAAVVAATLRCLWSRVERAMAELRSVATVQRWTVAPSTQPMPAWPPAYVPITRHRAWRSRHARRGPPSFFTR